MSQATERRIKRVICWFIGHAEAHPWWSQWCEHQNGYRHRAILMCCSYCMGTIDTHVEREG